jgi:hypothetical protein
MKANLPSISGLRRRCQALATLDLLLSPEWDYRYFSFNSRWSPSQQMGSMRNGSGDEWFCLFHKNGWAALKGLDHESKAWKQGGSDLSAALQRGIPAALTEFSSEPAFRWDATTFAFYSLSESDRWVRLNDLTKFASLDSGDEEHLSLLYSEPSAYVRYAADYFEVEIEHTLVEHIFAHRPITAPLVKTINASIDLEAIASELFEEIAYPK